MNEAPEGWPWDRPTIPDVYEGPEWDAYKRQADLWELHKKTWGGFILRYGRHGQFVLVWKDRRLSTGRFACRDCGQAVLGRRKFYCGPVCERAWSARVLGPTSWENLRHRAFARDGHRCVLCGVNPDEVEKELVARHGSGNRWKWPDADRARMRDAELEGDHVKPVALYPALEFDLANVRTLCHGCHARHGARPTPEQVRQRVAAASGAQRSLDQHA